ncbi:unnamed protein product [Heterobilharzia americana]|nr:unnamed protein product [Heterobilharzia americana]
MIILLSCAISLLFITYTISTPPSFPNQRPHLDCNITQQGFHLRLHCDFYDIPRELFETCQLHVHLPSGFFIDPYELASSQPKLNFSIIKPMNGKKTNSRIEQFVNWLTNSKKTGPSNVHEELIHRNLVDIEAPEWLAEPLTFRFNTDQLNPLKFGQNNPVKSLDIPVHLRYHLPLTKTDELSNTEHTTEIKHPVLNCPKSNNLMISTQIQNTFSIIVPRPGTSDLIFVMPITILLLIIGVIVLLMA